MNLMYVAVICALIGLVFAFVLTKRVNSVDAGTDRMKEIAAAIRVLLSQKVQEHSFLLNTEFLQSLL